MRRMVLLPAVLGSVAAALLGSKLLWSEEHEKEEKALLDALPKSKHTLVDGIQQAAAKSPEAAISAKFELDDGKLSLSVYTVAKGLAVDAEHNVLKELAGSPEAAKWAPKAETFADVPHVSRASQQHRGCFNTPPGFGRLRRRDASSGPSVFALTRSLRSAAPRPFRSSRWRARPPGGPRSRPLARAAATEQGAAGAAPAVRGSALLAAPLRARLGGRVPA